MATITGILAAASASAAIVTDLNPAGSVGVNIIGTFVATAVFEATTDGVNWFAVGGYPVLASGILSGQAVLSATAVGTFVIPVYGYTQVRTRLSAFTSGTVTVLLDISSGQAFVGSVNTEGQKASYSFAINAHAPAATPTDWFTIQGSATKTIRITRLSVQSRATAAGLYRVRLSKYSVFLTGGTPAAVTAVPHDSASAAATAVVQTWAGGLPTVGTLVGQLRDESVVQGLITAPAILAQPYDFGVRPSQAIVLRGTAQYVALNSAAVALPAGSVFDVYTEITEE